MTWNHLQLILRSYCGFYLGPIPGKGGLGSRMSPMDKTKRDGLNEKRETQANRENCKDSIPRVAFIHARLLVY